jgi:hypothetical protein
MNGLKGPENKSQKKGIINNKVFSQYTAEESKEDDEDEELIVHSPSKNFLPSEAQKIEKEL